jgi:L-fuconolactonase
MPQPGSDAGTADGGPGTTGAAPGITDAHLHLWDLARSPYTWLDGVPGLHRSIGWGDARAGHEALGITRVVLVQADDTRADTANLQEQAATIETDDSPVTRADVVAWLPLMDPGEVDRLLTDPGAMERVVGIRHLIHDEPDPGFLERPQVSASLDLLDAAGIPLDVPDAYARHMEQTLRVAEAHPGLTLVLDHLGKPPLGDVAAMGEWATQLRALAVQPNVVAKLSGLATSGDGRFEDAVAVALDAFGPDRLMFGSDWPIAPVPLDHDAGAGRLLAHLRTLGPDVGVQVLRRTAERVYRRSRSAGPRAYVDPTGGAAPRSR